VNSNKKMDLWLGKAQGGGRDTIRASVGIRKTKVGGKESKSENQRSVSNQIEGKAEKGAYEGGGSKWRISNGNKEFGGRGTV